MKYYLYKKKVKNMLSQLLRYILFSITWLVFSLPVMAVDINTLMLVNTCVGCHGPNGSSLGPATPSIAGMSKRAFIQAMQEGKRNERPTTIMGRIARGYTDKEIEIMADFFSKQKLVVYTQQVNAKKAERGAIFHKYYCEACHRDNGRKDEHNSGILAGQRMPYLKISLLEFLNTDRPAPTQMKKRLKFLVDSYGQDSIDELVHFYASQK
jgi:sulfide dehydrogenase cytochrome subunit